MPAQSQQQQKLFGLALSVKRGETPRSEASKDVLGIVDSMSEKEIEDFASTKHKGLPKMKEQLRKIVREIMRERAISELELSKDDMDKLHSDGEVEVDGEKVTYEEGKKRFRQQDGIGKAKYTISYHDGKQKHKDGSDFFGIQIFKNKKDLETFRNALLKKGYIEESVNEYIEPQTKKIAYYTGTRPEAVKDFVSKHGLNITKLLKYVEKGGLPQRMDFVSALAGRPNNPKQKKIIKQFQESVNESAGCGCGCGCGGSKVNEEFKSKDSTFEKVYGIFDKRDYFNAKGLAKVQIGNFERALQKNDKGAQQILDKFKGDMDKAKDYIIQVITDRKKEDAFNQYKAFKAAVDSIQKGKPIYGAVDLVKSRIHNNSQKYTMALYSALRNQKFNKWKDIHADVDSLIGESVNEARFDRNKLMRIMKKYDDAMIYTADGNEFLIYSPYSNNKDNAAMWHKNSVFALDKDATEHEIDYKDIVKIKG